MPRSWTVHNPVPSVWIVLIGYFLAMHRVVALVSAPRGSFELGWPAAVFREPPYRFSVCTGQPGNVRTTEGFDMVVTSGLRALDRADTIVVPGWLPINREPSS